MDDHFEKLKKNCPEISEPGVFDAQVRPIQCERQYLFTTAYLSCHESKNTP